MKKETIALITVVLLGLITAVTVYKRDNDPSVFLEFNNENNMVCSDFLSTDCAYDGTNSFKITPGQEYGPTWEISGREMDVENAQMLNFSYFIRTTDDCNSEGMGFAVSIHDKDGQRIDYESKAAMDLDCSDGDFESNLFSLPLQYYQNNNYMFKFYFWNLHRKTYYIDNMRLEVRK